MNRRCCNLHSQNSLEEVNMFHKILVAMDTSTIGKSVFDEALALAKATDPVSCCYTFCPLKAVQILYIFQPEYYSGLSGPGDLSRAVEDV